MHVSDQHKQVEELRVNAGPWVCVGGEELDVKNDFELFSLENGSPGDTVINHQLKVTCVAIYKL